MTRDLPRLLVLLACAVVVVMFWTNDDMAGEPDAPRGDGHYLPILDRGDGHMLYLMARSTALDLDWDFDNDLRRFGDPWFQPTNPLTHRREIPHPIGPALVWTPLVWTAEAGAVVANAFGADIPLHGYTPWHQRFVFLSSALAGCLAVLLGLRVARRALGGAPWASAYAAIAVLLGTPIAYYATYMPSYGHALDAAACAGFFAAWAATLGRCDRRRWLVLGALLGLAALIRVQDLALGIVLVVEVVGEIARDLRRRAVDWRVRALRWIAGGAITLAAAIVVFAPQLLYWKLVYGRAWSLPQGQSYTRFGSPMILELLFSPRNGWLSSTPVAYLALLGYACMPRRARVLAIGFAAAIAVQIYLNATIMDWWGMASFGQRRLCSVTMPLVVGLAALLWRCGRLRVARPLKHALALVVLAPMVAWNLWRVSQHAAGKPATSSLEPACCDHVPDVLRPVASWIYARVGDPFEFPANAWFALRHGVDLRRWDQAVGDYPVMASLHSLEEHTWPTDHGDWAIGYPQAQPYLIGAWSDVDLAADRPRRFTLEPRVRVLVPNLMPEGQRYTLWLAPAAAREVTVTWDDTVVAHATLHDGWNAVMFQDLDPAVGEHELTLETPTFPGMRGVAVTLLDVDFLMP
ncbi:MAG: hypothetical protein ACM31C_14125 [Acidobacteriota bacterium]